MMEHIFKHGAAILLMLFITTCQQSVKTPFSDNNPDTTGNNNNDEPSGYGQLYFRSSPSTPWRLTGPIWVNNGIILGENIDDSLALGACALTHKINFENSLTVTFLWKCVATGNALVKFAIADDTTRWQELPVRDNIYGWKEASFVPLNNWLTPIFIRFEFILPRGSRIRIEDVRGYGKE